MALIEVRDYPGPWLRTRWDVSGFWIDSGEEGQLFGADPQPSSHGSANVTWTIRWRDRQERDAAWEAVWRRHPGFEGYLQPSVRFLDKV